MDGPSLWQPQNKLVWLRTILLLSSFLSWFVLCCTIWLHSKASLWQKNTREGFIFSLESLLVSSQEEKDSLNQRQELLFGQSGLTSE